MLKVGGFASQSVKLFEFHAAVIFLAALDGAEKQKRRYLCNLFITSWMEGRPSNNATNFRVGFSFLEKLNYNFSFRRA